MARSVRIQLDSAKINNIFNNVTTLLQNIYPNLEMSKPIVYASGLLGGRWADPDTRVAFLMFIHSNKKLPKGLAKLHIYTSGTTAAEDATQLASFIEAFQALRPEAEFGAGGGYSQAAPNFLMFVEDMI